MTRGTLAWIVALGGLAGAIPAHAASGDITLGGSTEQGRNVKFVADSQGRVIRGAVTVLTDCSGRYRPFRARIELHRPLDRSTQDGFRDVGSVLEKDGKFSGRYRHEIEGDYAGARKIEGTLSLEVVFRRNGEDYVTCAAEDVEFTAKKLSGRGGRS